MTAPWVEVRILDFFNMARTIEDITESQQIKDHDGTGNTIGITVAARILETRKSLVPPRFQNLNQLLKIKGFGEDKLQDLIQSFNQHAADTFVQRMYNGIIFDNWKLTHRSTYFHDKDRFLQVVDNSSNFLDFVGKEMETKLIEEEKKPAREAQYFGELIRRSYVERFDNEHYGGIALGFWLYQFDADNWFSFPQVRQASEEYLSTYMGRDNRMELRMVKGFQPPSMGNQSSSTTQGTLPVVVNYAELGISLWSSILND